MAKEERPVATIESLRKQIKSAQELQSVVTTMKAMAATSIWHYEQAVRSLAGYEHTVALGLQIVLQERAAVAFTEPSDQNRLGAIILGSDQGMVGGFNDRIVRHAIDEINGMQVTREDRSLVAIGQRVANKLQTANQPVAVTFDMPGSISGLWPTVREMMLRLEKWQSQQQVDHIMLFYNQPLSGAAYESHSVQLLPLDLAWLQALKEREWLSQRLSIFDMEWEALFSALIREYFFVAVYRAFAASLAAENASRLSSMQAAENNIEERLAKLNTQYHQLRQSTITAELLDIVSGSEAVS